MGSYRESEFTVNSAISKSRYDNASISTVTNANPNLEWETTTSTGVGIDFELLSGRLTGSIDYFQRSTENLIFSFPEAATKPGPASPRFVNLDGQLVNSGIELGYTYKLINNDNVKWDFSANTSLVSNKIENFPGFIQTGRIHGQGLSGAYGQVLTNNQPLYSYFIFEFRGYDDTGSSLYTQPDGTAGPLGTAVKVLDKQALPKTNFGIATNASFGNWSVSTSFYGAFGHYLYNNTANALFFRGAYETRNIPASVISSGQAVAAQTLLPQSFGKRRFYQMV